MAYHPSKTAFRKARQFRPACLICLPNFPVILKTELKADGLETWRFGRALVLVRSGTREIEDVMYLTAPYDERGETVLASR